MTTQAVAVRSGALADYVELTKPRITLMVMFTALLGYLLAGAPGAWSAPAALLRSSADSALNLTMTRAFCAPAGAGAACAISGARTASATAPSRDRGASTCARTTRS